MVVCDVSRVARPHLGTIDDLARLQLGAVRRGERLCLRGACAELLELIALAGLSDLLPTLESAPEGEG